MILDYCYPLFNYRALSSVCEILGNFRSRYWQQCKVALSTIAYYLPKLSKDSKSRSPGIIGGILFRQVLSFLVANCYGLRDYRLEVSGDGLRGLGAMEGDVNKLFADRMKKRGNELDVERC